MKQVVISSKKSVTIDGVDYFVSQDMVNYTPPEPENIKKVYFKRFIIALLVVFCVVSKKIRKVTAILTVAGGLGSILILGLLKYVKPLKDWMVGRIVPGMMLGMDKMMKDVKLELLKDMKGDVLDFGSGGGGYLQYVAKFQENINSICCMEPCVNLHPKILHEANKCSLKINLYGGYSSDLLKTKGKEQFDFIIVGNVLCEVPSQQAVLSDIYDLLKPNGKVFFMEHVGNKKGTKTRKMEDRYNFLWNIVSGGCNMNRDTLQVLIKQPLDLYTWELTDPGPMINRHYVGLFHKSAK